MQRSTFSLSLTAVILLVGGGIIWFLIVAPRLGRQVPTSPPPPGAGSATSTPEDRHDALNVYLAAPADMPSGASRIELTLIKATLTRSDGVEVPAFAGVQRVMLQPGAVQKAMSEAIPAGHWTRLTLEFSPAAQAAMPDGTVTTALVAHRQALFTFDAELAISRTLALFARVPLAPELRDAGQAKTADIAIEPQPAESYVFGSFQLDPRGRGNLWSAEPSLPAAIKADLGFDIVTKLKGSGDFTAPTTPAEARPTP